MTATIVETDPLTDLDFREVVACEHSCHNRAGWTHFHHGPATHYARIIHDCPVESYAGRVYPCCQPFTDHVLAKQAETWVCPDCGDAIDGTDMCRIIATINGGTL